MPSSERTKEIIEGLKKGAFRVWPLVCLQPLRIALYIGLPFFILGAIVDRFLLR